ncbi:MAG: amidohydrolase family protein [Gammaproteobacteria bacterium]|nr:amidohydrolase family protein [Gammaproteobacteria bacterium]
MTDSFVPADIPPPVTGHSTSRSGSRFSCILLACTLAFNCYASDVLEKLHIIDWHAHIAGLGHGGSGAFINDEMRNNYRFDFFLKWMGVTLAELEQHGDRIVVSRLADKVAESRYVDQAVVLAMDGVIDRRTGQLDRSRTQFYVPNDHVYRETQKHESLLFGASINPWRSNSLELLEEVAGQGAMLVKWIPSIMDIDPADPAIIPFYRKMAELGLPLLTHTGMEKSFAHANDDLADPEKLLVPLQQGVTVIAAHIATTGKSEGQDNFERILPLFDRYPNLYTDISSLTQFNKRGYLARALKVRGLTDRMIYGTDWPLQYFPLVSPWYHVNHIGIDQAWKVSAYENPWDRDIQLKIAFGVPFSVFTRTIGTR